MGPLLPFPRNTCTRIFNLVTVNCREGISDEDTPDGVSLEQHTFSGTTFLSSSWKIQQRTIQNSAERLNEKIGAAEQTLFAPKKCINSYV